jgi:predicted RNA methylase
MVSTIKVPEEVREVLSRSTTTGKVLVLPAGLDRKLYMSVDKVLKALGGKWNKKEGGHLFDKETAAILGAVLGEEEVIDKKKTFQVFETPDKTADFIAHHFMLSFEEAPKCILEPSCGSGKLIAAVDRWVINQKIYSPFVYAVEIQEELLNKVAYGVVTLSVCKTQGDFLRMVPEGFGTSIDGVIMNPPFTRGQDMEHVMHAMEFVKPGGVLTSVMSPAWQTSTTSKAKAFRAWLEGFSNVEVSPLPEGSFKESGTNVRTVLVTIHKEL